MDTRRPHRLTDPALSDPGRTSLGTALDRRRFLALAALPAVAAVLHACGGDGTNSPATPPDATSGPDTVAPVTAVQASAKERISADPAQARAAVRSLNALGADLYGPLAAAADGAGGNLVFSPASIAVALTMARAGAAGTTAAEMDTVLHVDDPASIHRSSNALTASLEAVSGTFDVFGEQRDVLLSIANSMWAQSGMPMEPAFLDVLAEEYGAGVRTVDYRSDPAAAVDAINAWVDDETRGRIPNLLDEGSVTPDTRLTLVNAVYLKAAWRDEFIAEMTAPGTFTTATGEQVQVPTMVRQASWGHARGDGWEAVELPYVGDRLAMLIVLPDEGDLAALEADIGATLGAAVAGLETTDVLLRIPRWDTTTTAALAPVLADLGMPTAFTDAADLSGITTAEDLAITAVVHQANITVDEAGTEAAAATAVVAGATSAPVEVVELTVDRPFVFALRDTETGAVVFLGRVGDPSITA